MVHFLITTKVIRYTILFGIAAALAGSLLVASPAFGESSPTIDGIKLDITTGVTNGSYANAAVSVRRVSTGATAFSIVNPFRFGSDAAALSAGEDYAVTISPVVSGTETLAGSTWENGNDPSFNPATSNFTSGDTLVLHLKSGDAYHLRWLYRPTAAPTVVAASTPSTSPASAVANRTYMSDDKVASVSLLATAIDQDAICTVVLLQQQFTPNGASQVAGPYEVSCTNSSGGMVQLSNVDLRWSYDLANKLASASSPYGGIIGEGNRITEGRNQKFNSATQILSFTDSDGKPSVVFALNKSGFPVTVLFLGGACVLIVASLLGLSLRRTRKVSYDEYLRAKYYNL